MVRGCANAPKKKCEIVNDGSIPELGFTDATGTFCFCTSDLCNGARQSAAESPSSAPQISVGRMVLTFTVTSLLALVAARFFSQWWRRLSQWQLHMPPVPRFALRYSCLTDSRKLDISVCHFLSYWSYNIWGINKSKSRFISDVAKTFFGKTKIKSKSFIFSRPRTRFFSRQRTKIRRLFLSQEWPRPRPRLFVQRQTV